MSRVIAIDGVVGSGKSSMAMRFAHEMDLLHVDTGAMYRAIALLLERENIPFEEGQLLSDSLACMELEYGVSANCLIKGNGCDITRDIRKHEVSRWASQVAELPSVREYLLDFQRQLGRGERVCVMEGRDIGTVIFPDAFCKFFFMASLEIRAERRFLQLKEEGSHCDLEQIKMDIKKRDTADYSRKVAPLKKAKDAFVVDSSTLLPEDVIDLMKKIVFKQARKQGVSL